jgi:predicted TIM-barrel fold metal-dependent hydrolase
VSEPLANVPLVDVHIHYLPEALVRAFEVRETPPFIRRDSGALTLHYGGGYVEHIDPAASDLRRLLEVLDENDIDFGVLSINQPGVLTLPHDEAVEAARAANEELASVVEGSGRRLEGLATLAWQSPSEAATELERAADLGLKGAMVCSNIAGRSLDEEGFDQVFAAAERLDLPLLLHPTVPLSVDTLGPYGITCAAGFLFDTTTAVLRLVLGGTFDRHPGLKLIVGHSGSLLPQLAGRIELEYHRGAIAQTLPEGRSPADYLAMLYTDSVAGSSGPLEAALDLFGPTRVMFGSDYPFWDPIDSVTLLASPRLKSAAGDRVRGLTAMEIFRISNQGRVQAVSKEDS